MTTLNSDKVSTQVSPLAAMSSRIKKDLAMESIEMAIGRWDISQASSSTLTEAANIAAMISKNFFLNTT